MAIYLPIKPSKIIRGDLLGRPQVSYISEPCGEDFVPEKFMEFYKRHIWQNVMCGVVEEARGCVIASDPCREINPEDMGVIGGTALIEAEHVSDCTVEGLKSSEVHVIRALQIIRRMPYGRFSITGASPYRVDDGQLVVCNTHPGEASPFLGVVGVGILSQTVEDMKDYQNGGHIHDRSNFDSGRAFDELFEACVIRDAKNMGADGVVIGEIASETDIGGPKPTMGNHPMSLYLPVTYLTKSVIRPPLRPKKVA